MTVEIIQKRLEDAITADFKACEQRADEAYFPFCIGALMRNAESCSYPDLLIDPASIAQEINAKPLHLNKKDADTSVVAQVVALYTALKLAYKGYHITAKEGEGFVIQIYQDPETLYLSTSDIKARISRMRVEYVQ